MDDLAENERLSRIATAWSKVAAAHNSAEGDGDARAWLLQRYYRAAYRYLLACLRDPDAAEELCQDLAVRMLNGAFRRADPQQGRFRDYLKTALVNLVREYYRCQARNAAPLPSDAWSEVPDSHALAHDESADTFGQCWRGEILDRAWKALRETHGAYYAVLAARTQCTEATSAELAIAVATATGLTTNSATVRKTLERARKKFAQLLVAEVSQTLDDCDETVLHRELADLKLIDYCRSALNFSAK